MDETPTSPNRRTFRLSRPGTRPDYKEKLTRATVPRPTTYDALTQNPLALAEQVRLLTEHPEVGRTAFQSIAVVALQMLDRVRAYEHRAAEATISLAQRQKLDDLIEGLDTTRQALRAALSPQSVPMLDRNTAAEAAPESSWWFALCEALHVLEEGGAWIRSVVAGQAQGSAARTLSRLMALLLHQHYNALFAEADQWMS